MRRLSQGGLQPRLKPSVLPRSPTELGKLLGVSRQRAEQIIHPERLRARQILYDAVKCGKIVHPERCEKCGQNETLPGSHHEDYRYPLAAQWLCRSCHLEADRLKRRGPEIGTCPVCGKPTYRIGKNLPYCKRGCQRHAELYIVLKCEVCGGTKERLRSRHQFEMRHGYRHVFCGRPCLGKHIAKVGGFGVHPENRLRGSLRFKGIGWKHDWGKVWESHLATGFGAHRLSRLLGIPQGSISAILHEKRKAPAPV